MWVVGGIIYGGRNQAQVFDVPDVLCEVMTIPDP